MLSFDIRGKYFICPTEIIDCGSDEHARIALAKMLRMTPERVHLEFNLKQIFQPINDEQRLAHAARGVTLDVLGFLQTPDKDGRIDPRLFVVREWQWIRTRGAAVYAWTWDEKTLQQFLNAKDFWAKQPNATNDTWIDFYTVKTGDMFSTTLKAAKESHDIVSSRKN